jgi:hypothetical protein
VPVAFASLAKTFIQELNYSDGIGKMMKYLILGQVGCNNTCNNLASDLEIAL